MLRSVSIVAILLLSSAVNVHGKVLAEDSHEDKRGETRAKASYTLTTQGDNAKINISFSTRKTGVAGKGKGVMVFEILNDDFEPVFEISKGYTVGADAVTGSAEKKYRKSITATGPKAKKIIDEGLYVGFALEIDKDSRGIPTSVDDWKKEISDVAGLVKELDKLKPDDIKKSGVWRFKRIDR